MDFSQVQEEVKKIESGSNRNPDVIYFEDDTDTFVRLVPMNNIPDALNVGNQFVRAWVHYRSGGVVPNTAFSPRTFQQRDPVQEFVDLVLRERVSKEKFKQLKNMEPSKVYITTAVVRGKEEEGTKLLTFTEGQFKKFQNAVEMAFKPDDPNDYDITDVMEGYDLVVQVIGKENSDTNFRKFNINLNVRKSRPLANDKETIQSLLSNQPDWRTAFEQYSPDQIDSYLESSMEMGDDDEDFTETDSDEVLDNTVSSNEPSDEEILAQAQADFEDMVAEEQESEKAEPATVGAGVEDEIDEDEDDEMPF